MDDDARYMDSRGLQSPVRSAVLLADVQVQAVDDWCLNEPHVSITWKPRWVWLAAGVHHCGKAALI